MSVPVFAARHVLAAVDPAAAVEAVREAFLEHARGVWTMPPKVYVDAPPDGDFRAMPAAGSNHAVLKWVTSFPGNPARGLPTVSGVVLLSDARTGELRALVDAGAVTAVRTGAAAVLAAETLARPGAGAAGVVGCGVNGRATARTFLARGREVVLCDASAGRAREVAAELGEGAAVATDLGQALACDIVATITPGREPVLRAGSLRPGQHASLMGADGPGKAEIELDELLCRRGSSATSGRRQATTGRSRGPSRRACSRAATSPSSVGCSPARKRVDAATPSEPRSTRPAWRSRTSRSRSRLPDATRPTPPTPRSPGSARSTSAERQRSGTATQRIGAPVAPASLSGSPTNANS